MLAIIPARGGSKGLPGKNIKHLCGKPLITYTIEAAISANVFEKVIVNTDDIQIAEIAKKAGAEIPFIRPPELATDGATSLDMVRHTLKWFDSQQEYYDNIALLQPTSPLRDKYHIAEAFAIFQKKEIDSLISFVKEQHPIFWNKYIDEDGKIKDVFSQNESLSRQNYIETFAPNGAIYMFKSRILNNNSLYTDNTYGYVMDAKSSVDIDTQDDFEYCEFLKNRNA